MKDKRSFLLILLTAALVLTWAYHFYDKSVYVNQLQPGWIKDTTALSKILSDSLKKIFSASWNQFQSQLPQPDSPYMTTAPELKIQLSEIKQLKSELNSLMQKTIITPAEWELAGLKIRRLQQLTDTVSLLYPSELSEIREELNRIVQQIQTEVHSAKKTNSALQPNMKFAPKKNNASELFTVRALKFSALTQMPGQPTTETNQADRAEKFIVTFSVQNRFMDFDNAELIAVITDPSGKILIADAWEAGSFTTQTEGRKTYSKKIRFAYKVGELSKISFTLQPELFKTGIYKLHLYQSGSLIAESRYKLN